MNEIFQGNIYKENNLFNLENNPFKIKEISSSKKSDLNLFEPNHIFNQKPNRINIDNTRKSLNNIANKNNLKELKRFNTQINIKRMSIKNKTPKYSSNNDNNFILAKKNNLYGNKINNNKKLKYFL